MMRSDVLFAEPLAEHMTNPLRESARVDEDKRRPVLADKLNETFVNLVPHFVGGNRPELGTRNLDAYIDSPFVTNIYDDRFRSRIICIRISREKVCHFFDRFLRRREPDTQKA